MSVAVILIQYQIRKRTRDARRQGSGQDVTGKPKSDDIHIRTTIECIRNVTPQNIYDKGQVFGRLKHGLSVNPVASPMAFADVKMACLEEALLKNSLPSALTTAYCFMTITPFLDED